MVAQTFKRLGQTFLKMWESPWWAGGMALLVYALVALRLGSPGWETPYNYFAYLADAFLHGQLNLRLVPAETRDLVFYHSHVYLYWPPMPAILLMPLVAAFGVHVSDVLVVMLLGAADVALVAVFLRQVNEKGIAPLDPNRRALLVLFFALGSVLLPLAPFGNVWATGQLVAFLFLALAYLAAIALRGGRAFFLTGLALGCALLTRNHTVLMGLWPAYFLLNSHWEKGWKKLFQYCLLATLPVLVCGGLYLAYNYVRFGNPLQVGLDYHNMAPSFQQDYQKFGPFNLHYLPINFYYQYIYYPFPWRSNSLMGGSLFLLSPILFSIFFGIVKGRPRLSVLFLCLTIFLTSLPILLLMGTGWVQFGPRYTLDFTLCLLLLAAMGIKDWPRWLVTALVLLSCLQYIIGTWLKIVLG